MRLQWLRHKLTDPLRANTVEIIEQLPTSGELRAIELAIPTTDIIQSAFASPKPMLVWVHFLEMNAKNSYGGYVGYEPYKFAWRTNRIVAYVSPDNPDFWTYLNNK
jgi:hypothetical protein